MKTEADGRVFPTTDRSQTVVDTLLNAAHDVDIRVQHRVVHAAWDASQDLFDIQIANQAIHGSRSKRSSKVRKDTEASPAVANMGVRYLVLATGSTRTAWSMASECFGLQIVPPVPSLFGFKCKDDRLQGLEGVATEATVWIPQSKVLR